MNGESFRGPQSARSPGAHGEPETKQETLASLDERLDVLGAVDAAVDRRAEVMTIVEGSESPDGARNAVMQLLGVSEVGAAAVLAMQVRRFCAEERAKITGEVRELLDERQRLIN